ncbi:4-hydroxy-tetrahydrodipicolinate synthase [bacterium]|nr:4-hydroxy-tetrahydrodipicolinate synthase [bacterium]
MEAVFGKVVTAMVTPFKADDLEVNWEIVPELTDYLIENGSDGLVVAGTTGESPTLTFEEKVRLFKEVKERAKNKARVIAGTGSYCTAESIHLTKAAEEVGVDAIMLVVPYYNKPPQDGLYNHFRAIASQTSLPVILYNIPGRTACNLEAKTLARLAKDVPNIKGVKEASGNLVQVAEIASLTTDDFEILSGEDALTLPMLSVGGRGVISVASHIAGKKLREMIDSFFNGDIQKAKKIHLELLPLFRVLFITTNPIPVKTAMEMVGIKVGPPRPPLCPANEQQKEEIAKVMKSLGII